MLLRVNRSSIHAPVDSAGSSGSGSQRALLIGAGCAGSAIAITLLRDGVSQLVIHDADDTRAAALVDVRRRCDLRSRHRSDAEPYEWNCPTKSACTASQQAPCYGAYSARPRCLYCIAASSMIETDSQANRRIWIVAVGVCAALVLSLVVYTLPLCV
ncbi:MAG: hypothetical protein QM650_01235 [Microlunatus sp.]